MIKLNVFGLLGPMPAKTYKHTDIEVKIVPIKPEALHLRGCRGVVLY